MHAYLHDLSHFGAANAALELSLSANPSPAEPGETINLSLTVSNTDSFERSGVQIQMEYPLGLNNLREAAISGPGDCINTVSSGNLCEATETLVWSLGPIAAGRSRTVDLPPQVAASVTPGTEIIFNAEATDNSSDVASASDSVLVVGDRQLELSIQPVNQHPVSPGTEAIYQLNWGYSATSSAANNVNLSLPIPQGLSFVSADNGGTLVGNEVQWPLGTLVPGQVGEARVVLQTAGNLPLGRSITTEASLQAGSGPATRAGVISRLEADTGLRLAIEANANPAETGERIQLALTISNASPFDRSDVVVAMRFPVGFANLAENRITNAGNCINSVSNGNVCEVTERLIWNFDQIPAGRGITLTLPPALTALPGEWVMMDAYAVDSTGAETGASEAVAVVNDRTLELALSELTQDPAQPGGSVSYQLSWGHSATSAVAAAAESCACDAGGLASEVIDHDPKIALFGGSDGLAAYRTILPDLHRLVRSEGIIAFEIGTGQRSDVTSMLESAGFTNVECKHDLAGIERCLSALPSPQECQDKKGLGMAALGR